MTTDKIVDKEGLDKYEDSLMIDTQTDIRLGSRDTGVVWLGNANHHKKNAGKGECSSVPNYEEEEMAKEQREEKDHNSNHCERNTVKDECDNAQREKEQREVEDQNSKNLERKDVKENCNNVPKDEEDERGQEQIEDKLHKSNRLERNAGKEGCNRVSNYEEEERVNEKKDENDHNSKEEDVHLMVSSGCSMNRCRGTDSICNESLDSGYTTFQECASMHFSQTEKDIDKNVECGRKPDLEDSGLEQRGVHQVDRDLNCPAVDLTETLVKTAHTNQEHLSAGEKHGRVLIQCLLRLLKDMNVDAVIDVITGKELIDDLLLRDIREQQLTSEKIRKLVRHLQQRDECVYNQFKDCLHQTRQSDLVKSLEEQEVNILLQEETARRAHSKGRLEENSHLLIRKYYREIKGKVTLDVVMDHLLQDEVLDWNDHDEIRQYPQHRGVDRFLQKLLRKSQSAFECFLAALKQTRHTDLADKLEMTEECLTGKIQLLEWTGENIRDVWPTIEEYLQEELSPESIIDFFMERNIFSLDEYEFLFHCTYERRKRSKEFLTQIKNRLPEAIYVLLHALKETHQISMVEDLENIIKEGATADWRKDIDEQRARSDITVVEVAEKDYTLDGAASNIPCSTVLFKAKADENPDNKVEHEIYRIFDDNGNASLLLLPAGYVIEKVTKGSVIIYLRPVSRYSHKKFRDFCQSEGLKKFVLSMLKEEDIMASLSQGETYIEVQVVCIQEEWFFEGMDESKSMPSQSTCNAIDETHEMRGRLERIRENIIVHFDAVIDEIDPIFFENIFVARGILNKQFFKNIRETYRKRKLRAAVFLKEVLVKGGETLIALIDALKENGCSSLLDKLDPAVEEISSRLLPSTGAVMFKKEGLKSFDVHPQAGLMWSYSLTIKVEKEMKIPIQFKCVKCGHEFLTEREMKEHMLSHKDDIKKTTALVVATSASASAAAGAVLGPTGTFLGAILGTFMRFVTNLFRKYKNSRKNQHA